MQAKENNSFGTYLRGKLEQEGMSIRKLAHECKYDPATISRLINGKQKIRPEHLIRIADVLKIPIAELWQVAGFLKDEHFKEASINRKAISQQKEINVDYYSLPYMEGLESLIIAELEKYRLYAQTDEGQEMIMQNFNKKIDQIKGVGPFIDKVQMMFNLYLEQKTDTEERYIIGSVLLYFILPNDIVPDYLFPMGYLDDAMAIDLVWQQIQVSTVKLLS